MLRKILFILIITSFCTSTALAEDTKHIEIFDINEGTVVKKIKLDSKIKDEVTEIINTIKGIYVKANLMPNNGFAVKIPFEGPINIEGICTSIVFVFFPENNNPFILVLDEANRPFAYTIQEDAQELLRKLEFAPNPAKLKNNED